MLDIHSAILTALLIGITDKLLLKSLGMEHENFHLSTR